MSEEQVMTEEVLSEELPVDEQPVEMVDGDSATEVDALDDQGLGAPSLAAALEALLMVADEPMSTMTLAQATKSPVDEIEACLASLAQDYRDQGRGFDLREIAGGWRFYTSADCSPIIERWVLDGQQARLTQASLETLAVIAYRQPVTRGRVSAVRGVNVDGVIKTLLSRGLIEEAGHEAESSAIYYRTTSYFLERLGIASIDELPPVAEHIPDLADLDEFLDSVSTGE
jgi:segregation and condensation protein B